MTASLPASPRTPILASSLRHYNSPAGRSRGTLICIPTETLTGGATPRSLPVSRRTRPIPSVLIRSSNKDPIPNTTAQDEEKANSDLGVRAALSLLRFYKREISPLMLSSCRYVPTCSEYSMEAYKKYGVGKGTILTAWRLCRCNPLVGDMKFTAYYAVFPTTRSWNYGKTCLNVSVAVYYVGGYTIVLIVISFVVSYGPGCYLQTNVDLDLIPLGGLVKESHLNNDG